ncbi:glycosyltransferase family 4 protein [Streptomyces sp. NPDC048825]|uniref:glycosyltransferase family 4 protein n=1 Tax=Streptomyces sp. NPDC048825 TaxID=3365592 RepID=UPI00371E6E59
MRITHVAPTCFGVDGLFGGGERYPVELARALAREVDCELVTFGRHPRRVREQGGLRVRVLRPWVRLHGHPAHPVSPLLPSAVSGADAVHVHHMRSAPGRTAALVGTARGQALAVTDHGLGGGGWAGLLPGLFDRFLTVSRFSAQTLEAPPDRTTVVYGGADPARYFPGAGAAEDCAGVLFVGRLTPHKGVDRLLRALSPDVPLTVVGTTGHDPRPPESGYPQLLSRLASGKQVRFVHQADDAEVAALYRRAAVFCLPSVPETCYGRRVAISELLGLAVIEAMASGTAVVCSRVGGLPEVVRDGETGFLVDPGDVAQLRDRIRTLVADRPLARRLGENARQLVLERFTWDACAQRCLTAYQQMGVR